MSAQVKSEVLLAVLRSGETRDQYLALSNLGATTDPRVVSAVVSCLKSDNSDIRVEATKALGRIGAVAMPPIIKLLQDQAWDIDSRVGTVVNLLSRMGFKDPEAKILTETIKQPDMKDLYDGVKAFLSGAIFVDRRE